MNWRREYRLRELFGPDPGPHGPWQSVACDQPGCPRPSYGHPTRCELHRHRGGPVLVPDIARFVGPTNAARQSEERGSR